MARRWQWIGMAMWLMTQAGAAELSTSAEHAAPLPAAQHVAQAERAFARAMAERDFAAFQHYVADDAVFFGRNSVQRGKAAVLAAWQPLFAGAQAPFSWEPAQVEVLASGTLAHSSGPVRDPDGTIVGQFNSVWRLEPDGQWRVVFDKGSDVCNCPGR